VAICAKPLGLRSAGIGGAGEGLRVTVGLPAVAGGLARAGQAALSPGLFVLVTALDRQGQCGRVPGAGLVGLAGSEGRFVQTVECLGLAREIAGDTGPGSGLLDIMYIIGAMGKRRRAQKRGGICPCCQMLQSACVGDSRAARMAGSSPARDSTMASARNWARMLGRRRCGA
jgi:hypothetical protein